MEIQLASPEEVEQVVAMFRMQQWLQSRTPLAA